MEKVQSLMTKYHIRTRLSKLPSVVTRYAMFLEESKKPLTVYEYIKDIQLFIGYLTNESKMDDSLSDGTIKSITKSDVVNFFNSYLPEFNRKYERLNGKEVEQEFHNSIPGLRRKLSSIRSFCHYLQLKERWLNEDVTHGIEFNVDSPKKAIHLNQRELDLYFSAIETHTDDPYLKIRNRLISKFFLHYALKTSELIALDIQDIDMERRCLTLTRRNGEKETVPLRETMIKDIERYLKERELRNIPHGWHYDALFVSERNQRINPKTILYTMKKYKRFTPIEKSISPQIFRNTFSFRSLQNMYSRKELAKKLGNKKGYVNEVM